MKRLFAGTRKIAQWRLIAILILQRRLEQREDELRRDLQHGQSIERGKNRVWIQNGKVHVV